MAFSLPNLGQNRSDRQTLTTSHLVIRNIPILALFGIYIHDINKLTLHLQKWERGGGGPDWIQDVTLCKHNHTTKTTSDFQQFTHFE